MKINYDVLFWQVAVIIFVLFTAYIAKKLACKLARNEHGHISKTDQKQINYYYSTFNYAFLLVATIAVILVTSFFGVNFQTSHKTVNKSKTIKAPSNPVLVQELNETHEQQVLIKRDQELKSSKQQTKDEYENFLNQAVNQSKKE